MYRRKAAVLTAFVFLMACNAAQGSLSFSLNSGYGLIPGINNFHAPLTGVGLANILSGTLTATSAGTVNFYFHGQESGWHNAFTAKNPDDSVAATFSESTSFTAWVPGGTFFGSLTVEKDQVLKLEFDSHTGPLHAVGTSEFGILATSANSVFASDGRIYFAHDDTGAGPDDNHDDLIISAEFVPAPEATSLLIWGGLLSLAAIMIRRKE